MNRYRRLIPVVQPILHQTLPPLLPVHPKAVCPAINVVCTRHFSCSPPVRGINFDTLKVVQRLEAQGFTPEQSKAVMELLKDVIDESVLGLTRTMVTRDEQDKVVPSREMIDNRQSTNKKSTLRNCEVNSRHWIKMSLQQRKTNMID
jgi:hypothetical protein